MELHGKDATPNSLKDEVHSHVQAILEAPDEDKASKAMSILEAGFYDASAVILLPEKYRKRFRTTNSIERLNEEIRRREQVIRLSPNKGSLMRLARCPTHGTGREMEEYFTWQESEILSQTHKDDSPGPFS